MAEMKKWQLPNGITVQASEEYAERMFPGAVVIEPENKAKAATTKSKRATTKE